jgi:hypothetical protein
MTTQPSTAGHAKTAGTAKYERGKISAPMMAKLNTWAIALSCFIGFAAIFSAIAGFSDGWAFRIPAFSVFFGVNSWGVPTEMMAAFIALAASIFGIVTIKKVTDKETQRETWHKVANLFLGISVIYIINLAGIIFYSLMMLGRPTLQGGLWLSNFLPTLILLGASIGMHFIAKTIYYTKPNLVKTMAIIAICVAGVSVFLTFTESIVVTYIINAVKYGLYR